MNTIFNALLRAFSSKLIYIKNFIYEAFVGVTAMALAIGSFITELVVKWIQTVIEGSNTNFQGKAKGLLTTLFVLAFLPIFSQQCDCFDVLYLNDTGANVIEKFRVNDDGSLTEIGDAANGSCCRSCRECLYRGIGYYK